MSRYLVEKTKTTGQGWQSSNRYFENCGERSLGQFLSVSFLVAYYILPQYFGIRLPGFDLTAQRMLITILCLFLLSKESRKKMFWEGVRSCRLWLFMAGYLGICFYTAVLRFHIGTFLYPFIELVGAFLVIYVLREYLGSDGFLVLFRRMLLFLCVLGLVEAVMRKTPFAYLETIRGLYTGGMIRSGAYRIMGPANHSLAYGLILISGLPLLCIDEEKHCFTLFRHLPLLLLVVVNVFLTGSRSTLAVMGLELLLLTVLAPGEQRKKLLFTIVPAGLLILLLAFLFPNSPPGHYILLQLSTVVDEMFGTSYAIRYGVDSTSLANSASYRDALLDIFTVDWLNRCGRFWTGQKKSKSTLSVYFKMLKAIMNRAKADGIIKEAHFPFGRNRFEIPSAEGRKLALTLEQIKRLVTYTDGREETELYRDMWFFSYLCNGINFRDMLYLTYGNIVGGEICFVRAKTMNTSKQVRTIRAVLTPEMRKIMDRWGNPDDGNPGTLIFKFATGKEDGFATKHLVDTVIQKCNKVLGRIAEAVGLPPVTTYSARHSFATVLKRSGTNISYISESLGHSNLAITENYLASFERDERMRNAQLLTKFD